MENTNTITNAAALNDANANAAKEFAALTPAEIAARAAALILQYETISAIRGHYAELTAEIGKDNFAAVLTAAKEIRAKEIENAAGKVDAEFTHNKVRAAVFGMVAKSAGYAELCALARRAYEGNDDERAAAVVKDYFTAVNADGAPLCKVNHINAAGTEIYTTYEIKKLTHNNAVAVLKTALDNMGKTARNIVMSKTGNDAAAAVRKNVKTSGVIVAVYAAALDENNIATIGARRDTSKDAKTKKDAAQMLGQSLPVGCVPVVTWNAAANGNETAAAAVDAAKDAAKDAAARRPDLPADAPAKTAGKGSKKPAKGTK